MKRRSDHLKIRNLNRQAGRVLKKLAAGTAGHTSLKAGLIFAGFGAVIYISNRLIPKIADDYAFSFVWDGKTNGNLAYGNHRYRRIRTMKDLAASQLSHYMTWSGRTIGETLNQLVLMKDDKRLYDCLNTGVILSQLSLCLFAGRGKISMKKVSPALALMLTAGYWFGTPHLVATSLWTTGAANYSWPGLLQSAFLLPYGLQYHDDSFSIPRSVAALSGLLAGELGLDIRLAKRAGLLHDIGKAVDHEMEGSHVQLGAELCRKYKESQTVINAVESHHGDVEPNSLIACIVQAADTISAARPGARRETLETYTTRLKQLEEITNSFKGVSNSYAIQAGREVRVMVVPEQIGDSDMVLLARDISKKIENEMEYPGQIKVSVIRESRVTDFAK